MKTIILFFTLLVCCVSFAQTSEDEYKYITEDYKVQLANNLGNKTGYSFKPLGDYGLTFTKNSHLFTFRGLKKGSKKKYVGINDSTRFN